VQKARTARIISPATELAALVGRRLSPPGDPRDWGGSSVYLGGAHNPIDLREITFGDRTVDASI
jgi:hypothetical protein